MNAPQVFVPLGPIHPHLLFEFLAYAIGFQVYRLARRDGDALSTPTRWRVIVAAAIGAAVGSKLLALVNEPSALLDNLSHPVRFMAAGKTMVGGLLGGWFAVEFAKRRAGIRERTGDLFALPLCVGIAIGRLGCFLTGLPDHTFGTATTLPWGIDFGDGVLRHPTQLYEIVFLAVLGLALLKWRVPERGDGLAFRCVLVSYLAFRLAVDFLKPGEPLLGLTAIQWACALALVYHLLRRFLR